MLFNYFPAIDHVAKFDNLCIALGSIFFTTFNRRKFLIPNFVLHLGGIENVKLSCAK